MTRPDAAADQFAPGGIPRQGADYRTLSIDEALDFAQSQVRRLAEKGTIAFPSYTVAGRWVDSDPWAPSWTGGFLAGLMWYLARYHDDDWWVQKADAYCLALESRKDDRGTHDLGFIFGPSWGARYQVRQDDRSRQVLVEAGRTMAQRIQPGGYLSSWVDPGNTFVDIMMNVGIVFEAARLSGDERLTEIALSHCRATRRHLMRGDGSAIHEGWFDPQSGQFLRAATHQGWRADSSWARGQAWATYGFTTAYLYTQENAFLQTACAAADYFIEQTPSLIPPNDWHDPAPTIPAESSASAAATSALLTLSTLVSERERGEKYRRFALSALTRLCSTEFIAADEPEWEGILRHAIYNEREGLGVDESVMWGDYYFVESLVKAAELDRVGVEAAGPLRGELS